MRKMASNSSLNNTRGNFSSFDNFHLATPDKHWIRFSEKKIPLKVRATDSLENLGGTKSFEGNFTVAAKLVALLQDRGRMLSRQETTGDRLNENCGVVAESSPITLKCLFEVTLADEFLVSSAMHAIGSLDHLRGVLQSFDAESLVTSLSTSSAETTDSGEGKDSSDLSLDDDCSCALF